jgi:hypothetical protein
MKRTDVAASLLLVSELWPRSNWPQQLREKFAVDLTKLELDGAQAEAALVAMRSEKPYQKVEPCDLLKRLESIVPKAATVSQSEGEPPLVKLARQLCRQGTGEPPHQQDRVGQMSVGDLAQFYLFVLFVNRHSALQHAIGKVREMLEQYWGRSCATDPAFARWFAELIDTTIERNPPLRRARDELGEDEAVRSDELTPKLDRAKPKQKPSL